MDLNKEFILKWADALDSGNWKQGTNFLRTNDGFCCFGVTCDLVDPNGWESSKFEGQTFYTYNKSVYGLPLDIVKLINIDAGLERILMSMNDGGKTFGEIAQYLRSLV